ncbi:MAG: hypothetical protein AABZ14_05065, partial [Candidatus Margulisiibacteriota bacterium]
DTGGSRLKEIAYVITAGGQVTSSRMIASNLVADSFTSNWVISWNDLVEGQNDVLLYATDNAGNAYHSPVLFHIRKDTQTPTMSDRMNLSLASQNAWYGSAPAWTGSVSLNFADQGDSKLRRLGYVIRKSGQSDVAVPIGTSITLSSYVYSWSINWDLVYEGTNNVGVYAGDHALNAITWNNVYQLKKDISPPYILDEISFDSSKWHNAAPSSLHQVTISFYDDYSGLSEIEHMVSNSQGLMSYAISQNAGNESRYLLPWIVSWNTLTNGLNEIAVGVTDQVGNALHQTVFTVRKDIITPVFQLNTNKDWSQWYKEKQLWMSDVVVSFNDEGGSMINQIQWTASNNAVTLTQNTLPPLFLANYATPFDVPWEALPNGINEFWVSVNDVALNVSRNRVFTVRKDENPPTFTVNGASTSQQWYASAPSWFTSLNAAFSDSGGSSLNTVRYIFAQNNQDYFTGIVANTLNVGVSALDIAPSWNAVAQGTSDIRLAVEDNAQNRVERVIGQVKKDTSVPSINSSESSLIRLNRKQQEAGDCSFNIDFYDSNPGSPLQSASYAISVNQIVGTYYQISIDTQAYSFTQNWTIPFNHPPEGYSDLMVAVTDFAGNAVTQNVLRLLRDVASPIVLNNEPSSKFEPWFNRAPNWLTSIDVALMDAGETAVNSKLKDISFSISNNVATTWNSLTRDILTNTYNARWTIPWATLQNGTNDITISFNDYALNAGSSYLFSVKKDVISPSYENAETVNATRYTAWYNEVPTWISQIRVSFTDTGYSGLNRIQYGVSSNVTKNWQNIVPDAYGISSYNTPWTISWDLLVNGTNNVLVSLDDRAANSRLSPILFSVKKDVLAPSYNSWMIPDSATFNRWYAMDIALKFDVDFTDTGNSALSMIQYGVSNSVGMRWLTITQNWNKNTFTPNWQISWNVLTQGLNEVFVSVNDRAGNKVSSGVLFVIKKDTISPSYNTTITKGWVMSLYEAEQSPVIGPVDIRFSDAGGSQIMMAWYGVSSNQSVAWYSVSSNTLNVDSYVDGGRISDSVLGSGTTDILVRIQDNAGWMTTSSVLFTILKDSIPPSFNLLEKENSTTLNRWYSSAPGWLNQIPVDVYDYGGSMLSTVSYVVSYNNNGVTGTSGPYLITRNGMMTTYNYPIALSWNVLTNGINDIILIAEDHAMNTMQKRAFTIRKDTVAPTFDNQIASQNGIFQYWYKDDLFGTLPYFKFDFFDTSYSKLNRADYLVSSNGWIATANIFSNSSTESYVSLVQFQWSKLTDGRNDIFMIFQDNAGNVVTVGSVLRVNKDTLNPSMDLMVNPEDQELWYNRAPPWFSDLSSAVSDNGQSMLKKVSYKFNNADTVYPDQVITENLINTAQLILTLNIPWGGLLEGTSDVTVRVSDKAQKPGWE